jgi:hypothetical protein
MDAAATQRDGERPLPDQVLAQAKLRDEADGVAVATKEVVVELVQPDPGLQLEAGGQAPGDRLALDDHHPVAALDEPEGDRQAQCPSAQDCRGGQSDSAPKSC